MPAGSTVGCGVSGAGSGDLVAIFQGFFASGGGAFILLGGGGAGRWGIIPGGLDIFLIFSNFIGS